MSELDGSDVIIVGHVGFSTQGKAIIKTGFTKYMSFRRISIAKLDSHFNLTSKAVLLDLLFRSMISALRLR